MEDGRWKQKQEGKSVEHSRFLRGFDPAALAIKKKRLSSQT